MLAACSSNPEPSAGSQAPCGAPPGDWQYLLSCDSTFGSTVHECTDYYATRGAASAVDASFRAVCKALSGTVLDSVCPSAGSVGSCLNTASSGPPGSSPAAALSRTYIYDPSTTSQSYKANCEKENGVYAAPGVARSPTGTSSAASSCSSESGNPDGGLFSVETVVNGEVIECTNYVGAVTEAQFDSVRQTGALSTPCPLANAICSCSLTPGSGVFGTDPQLVYYKSTVNGYGSTCPSSDASCKPSYALP
jgi:hypothetical protein